MKGATPQLQKEGSDGFVMLTCTLTRFRSQRSPYCARCGEATRPDLMSDGILQHFGNEVHFDSGFLNTRLVGQFLTKTEKFRVDGSVANVDITVEGRECLLDLVVVSMEASTIDPKSFEGTFSAQYQANRPVEGAHGFRCFA